ncbi:MAG: hypothetical protein U0894_11125 [Pirellulales bacterium]
MKANGERNSNDILGLAAFGEAAKIGVQGLVDGTGAFLSRICLPAAEEIGLYFADNVRHWRKANFESVLKKAEEKLALQNSDSNLQIHPRMASKILEEASWIDDPFVQDAWSGLLASACTEDGQDDSNLVFVNLLAELTSTQVKILNLACENADKMVGADNDFVSCIRLEISAKRLMEETKITDLNKLDFQLDDLRYKGLLIDGGFESPNSLINYALIQPTSLALNLYIRGQGCRVAPHIFFNLKESPHPDYFRKLID